MVAVKINSVFKSYGALCAVNNVTAQIPVGSIYGFLGPNGAGKTTLIRMIMNIIPPDQGQIEIMGQNHADSARKRIGYMPEERGLYQKMKVRSVLAYLGALKGMNRKELALAIDHWLREIDLQDRANKKVEELSKGMQQKVQFIVTLLNNPDILILDEPFAGLDPLNLELVKNIMLRLRQEGKTVIFSTHMMDQAEQLCDFFLLINKGKKVFDGTLDQVRTQFSSNVVSVKVDGDASFIAELPLVNKVINTGKRLEITLAEQADSQDLLRALIGKVQIQAFEAKLPSLHEIFIRLVGNNEQDA